MKRDSNTNRQKTKQKTMKKDSKTNRQKDQKDSVETKINITVLRPKQVQENTK